ncbi:MAG: multidrug effflux MFS transporter [Hyphomicrobiales bacterium]|nr:multidrug effflux MFS transporter [Hyphomicrobiales bacterium]
MRLRLVFLLGAVTAFAPFATDMYLGSLGDIAASLRSDAGAVQMTVSTFFGGMAVGQLFYGPAIDRWGRKKPLLVGIGVFTIASALLIVAPNLSSFLALRFVQAVGGCAGMIIARAIIRDVFDLRGASSMLSQMMLVQGLGPVLAPVIGAQVASLASWHWIFALLSASGLFWFAAIGWGLPETLPAQARRSTGLGELARAAAGLARRIDFVLPAATAASAMGALFAFIGGSAFVFMEHFGLSRDAYSLVFGANAACMIAASQLNRLLVGRFAPRTVVMAATSFAVLAALVLIAVSGVAHWAAFLVPLILSLAGGPLIAANAQAIAMSRSGEYAGTASSLVGIVQYLFAGSVIAIVGALHDGTTLPMAAMIAICSGLSFLIALVGRLRGAL